MICRETSSVFGLYKNLQLLWHTPATGLQTEYHEKSGSGHVVRHVDHAISDAVTTDVLLLLQVATSVPVHHPLLLSAETGTGPSVPVGSGRTSAGGGSANEGNCGT